MNILFRAEQRRGNVVSKSDFVSHQFKFIIQWLEVQVSLKVTVKGFPRVFLSNVIFHFHNNYFNTTVAL